METRTSRGIIFDKDGTLIDFERTWFPIVTEAIGRMRIRFGLGEKAVRETTRRSGILAAGFAKESLIQSATTSAIARLWAEIAAAHGAPVPALDIDRLLTDTAAEMAHTTTLVPGAKALLERLKKRGRRLGIATSDNRVSTAAGLSRVGILDYFDFIAADGDGLPAKPEPDAAFAFASRFRIAPEELAVFGDSRGDMLFAERAGARFIGMRTASNRSDRFVAAGYPTIADFEDLDAVERLIA